MRIAKKTLWKTLLDICMLSLLVLMYQKRVISMRFHETGGAHSDRHPPGPALGVPSQRSAVQASLAAAGSQGTRQCMSGVSPGFRSLFSHCQSFFRMAQRSFPGQHRNLAEPAGPLQRTF